MSISKRQLTKWRKEALRENAEIEDSYIGSENTLSPREVTIIIKNNNILSMTQELLDQYLLKEK